MKTYFCLDSPKDREHCLRDFPLELSGWGFFSDAPARLLEVSLRNRGVLLLQPLTLPRPDVAAAYPQGAALKKPLGFKAALSWPAELPDGAHRLELFLWDNRCRRKKVAEISLEVRTSLAEFSFEDRFASLPLGLVLKVNGSTDPNAFREIGNSAAAIIQEQAEGLLAHGTPAVLDFGCGLGRVLFALQRRFAHCRFTGFDIDPAMLRWGRWLHSGLPCEFTSTTNGYADQAFDFIYAISVFTHLDKQTDYWLGEIARLLTPRGRALLTFHDDTLFSEDHPALGPLKESYVCGADTPEGGAGMGTFYTRAYWEKKLQAFFNVETTRVRGMFGHQSFSVASKKPGSAPAPQAVRGYLKALEEEVALYRLGKLGE